MNEAWKYAPPPHPSSPPHTTTGSRCSKEQPLLHPNLQHFTRVLRIAQLNMVGSASGGAVKRQREKEKEEEDAPAMVQLATHAEPLMLLVLVKAHFGTLVWLQLSNQQGDALFCFVRLPPRLPRPFAGAAVYDMSLTPAERLRAVGCGFKGRLVRLLSLGIGHHFEPQRNLRACHQMMHMNARRVASKLMAALRGEAAKEAEELCASGQCAAALVPLQRAIEFGHLPSRALKAWLHIEGREGVALDHKEAFELAEEGASFGCQQCQGVLAYCYWGGYGCARNHVISLELARESSGRGSRYGQHTLGGLHYCGIEGLSQDCAQALAFLRLSAAQGLDAAQYSLGRMCSSGWGVAQDLAEALRLSRLAAAQGHRDALFMVAYCHEEGQGVTADMAEAIRWYKRAQAAGSNGAARKLRILGASAV